MGDSHSLLLLTPCLIPLRWGPFGWLADFLLETSVDKPHFGAGVKGKNQENISKRSLGTPRHVLAAQCQSPRFGEQRDQEMMGVGTVQMNTRDTDHRPGLSCLLSCVDLELVSLLKEQKRPYGSRA